MKTKSKVVFEILIVYAILLGMTALPLVVNLITRNVVLSFVGKMLIYSLVAMLVIIICRKQHKKVFKYLGFSKENITKQLLSSFIPFLITISVFVLLPLLFGADKKAILSVKYTNISEIILRIVFLMLFVGPVEEIAFRGYIFSKLKEITSSEISVCIISALLFGFWHFPSTMDIINVLFTSVIGFIFAFSRMKIKNCTTLSLSVAHGLHDTVILILSCFI